MKTLKPGIPVSVWPREYSCTGKGNGLNGCGAVLLIDKADFYLTHSSARDEDSTYITFQCHDCKVETDIWSDDRWRGYGDMPPGLKMEWIKEKDWS